jgi:tetratricopeptide (TPR) repeat protein
MRDPRHRRRRHQAKNKSDRSRAKSAGEVLVDPFAVFAIKQPELAAKLDKIHNDGMAMLAAGDLERGEVIFHELLELSPNDSPYRLIANNNLGVCHFGAEQYEKARDHLLATLAQEPSYTFALALLTRVYMAMGERAAAAEMLKLTEASCVPENIYWAANSDAIFYVIEAYADFNEHKNVLRFTEQVKGLDIPAQIMHKAGIAAFNLNRYSVANRWWRLAARELGPDTLPHMLARTTDLMREHKLPPFQLEYIDEPDIKTDPTAPDYLTGFMKCVIINALESSQMNVAIGSIQSTRHSDDPWVEPFLRALLLTRLPMEIKNAAWVTLHEMGKIQMGDRLRMRIDDVLRDVVVDRMEIPLVRQEEADSLFHQANELKAKGRLDAAEAKYRQALELNPLHYGAAMNLANTLRSNRPQDKEAQTEARNLLERVLRQEPGLPEALFNLAGCYLEQYMPDEAKETLARLDLSTFPKHLMSKYWHLQGYIALLNGEYAGAGRQFAKGLKAAVDEHMKEIHRAELSYIKEITAEDSYWNPIEPLVDESIEQLLSRKIKPGLSLVDAFWLCSADHLEALAVERGFHVFGLSKGEMVTRLVEDFQENMHEYLVELTRQDTSALAWLLRHEGTAPYGEYARRFGPPADPKDRLLHEKNFAAEKLVWLGWVVVGICDDEEDVAGQVLATLPAEVYETLQETQLPW